MRLSRRSRCLSALLALICVLFAQIAVAAYACPSMQIGQAMASIAVPAVNSAHHQEMAGCVDMDFDQPLACHDYGQSRSQSLDKPAAPDVQPFVASSVMLTISLVDPSVLEPVLPLAQRVPSRATSPPLIIRNCCFRI